MEHIVSDVFLLSLNIAYYLVAVLRRLPHTLCINTELLSYQQLAKCSKTIARHTAYRKFLLNALATHLGSVCMIGAAGPSYE